MRVLKIVAPVVLLGFVAGYLALRLGGDPIAAEATEDARSGALAAQTEKAAVAETPPPVPVLVIESVAAETQAKLIVRGRTQANRNVMVAAETTGRVISEPLRRGATVEKGRILCRLDPGVRAAELAEAEAAVAEAQIQATAATRLQSKGFAAQTTLKEREARLQASQARLDKVRWDIAQLEIRAPFSGLLETDTAELGAYLSPGAQCANVIDLSSVKVSGFVSEQEIDALRTGQHAAARLINGKMLDGTISFLSRVADPDTRTYSVEVTLENPDGSVRDGMTAELSIDLPARLAHLIPQSALTLDDEGRLGVRLDQDGIARFMPVTILSDEVEGVRVAGLPETARIITIGQDFVRDGREIIGTVAEQIQ